MMDSETYQNRREELFSYFDRTAADAWARLTSTEKVSGVRATVREGRNQMRKTLLNWLPSDMSNLTLLDAGCGTGMFSVDAARRGARVTAVDLSPTLIELAEERLPTNLGHGSVDFKSGDMLEPLGFQVDHAVMMDSLIHYQTPDMVNALCQIASQVKTSVVFTFAPSSALLRAMHSVGKLFPRGDRAPAIEPVSPDTLFAAIKSHEGLMGWDISRTERISSGFYTSQAVEITRK